jgi:signal transduction histidine kinase
MNRPSILIVEDEVIVAEDLARKVRQLGYQVAGMTDTGEESITLARLKRPALVLMDIRLGGAMDGIEAAEVIHREGNLPVLFLTAHSDTGTVERARQAEAFGYILKPFDERDLRIQIEMALYKHAAEQSLLESKQQVLMLNQQLESLVLERTGKLRETVKSLKAEIAQRQRLEREILEISEREQRRFGQDLHDGLGQELAGIAMLGDVQGRILKAEGHPSAAPVVQIASYVRTSIDSLRGLAKGLYPIELDRSGLFSALKDLAAQTSRYSGIDCELRQSGESPQLDKSAEIHIYRIVQECIGNAVKHGKPRHIRIESVARDCTHVFMVSDDGVGFDKATVAAGMGLHLIEYRARVIGAQITIERPAQGGCRIACCLPARRALASRKRRVTT